MWVNCWRLSSSIVELTWPSSLETERTSSTGTIRLPQLPVWPEELSRSRVAWSKRWWFALQPLIPHSLARRHVTPRWVLDRHRKHSICSLAAFQRSSTLNSWNFWHLPISWSSFLQYEQLKWPLEWSDLLFNPRCVLNFFLFNLRPLIASAAFTRYSVSCKIQSFRVSNVSDL